LRPLFNLVSFLRASHGGQFVGLYTEALNKVNGSEKNPWADFINRFQEKTRAE